MGNLTSKTGVGSYTYHAAKKHQAITAGASSYGYDANGNMTNRAGSTVTWYSYNLPNTINGPSSNTSQFFYGPDRQRWKQTASYAGTAEETIYIGGLIEKATLGGVTSWRHYIAGSTGTAAIYIRRSNGTTETDYLLKDHLGSLDMITRSNGTQMARASSDAWGRRRNGGTWAGNPAGSEWTAITNTTRRGFTSHEHLDNLSLIHMNGRVFDPVLARFLSADPIIDGAGSTQGWNRYSYVHNNPLSRIDPSGFNKERPNTRPQDGSRCNSDWGGGDGTTISSCAEGRHERGVAAWLSAYSGAMRGAGMAPVSTMSGRGWFTFHQLGGFRGATGPSRAEGWGQWVRSSASGIAQRGEDGAWRLQVRKAGAGYCFNEKRPVSSAITLRLGTGSACHRPTPHSRATVGAAV